MGAWGQIAARIGKLNNLPSLRQKVKVSASMDMRAENTDDYTCSCSQQISSFFSSLNNYEGYRSHVQVLALYNAIYTHV